MRVRRPKTEKIARAGEQLEEANHPQKAEIRSRCVLCSDAFSPALWLHR